MIKDSLKYCEIICNYLNNLKGEIELDEIIKLMWCVFGAAEEDLNIDLITNDDILKLSSDVSYDDGTHFYEDLYFLYKKINNEKPYIRKCSECGKEMHEGYCIENGMEYYCSDECLHKHYTEEEFDELYDDGNGDSYWTEWEE